MTRQPISKKVRMQVFERDKFKCRYCGARANDTVLQIDHHMSVANGGTNSPDNLYTACVACNLGKGSRVLKTESSDDLSTEEWIVEARIGFEEIVGSPPHDADIENYAIRASVFAYGIDTVLQVFERHADAFKFSDASRLAAFGRLILLCHEDLEREWAEIDAWRRKNEDGYV